MSIRIAGTGSYVPEKILTNADLEKLVDTNDEWIKTRTGIAERHIAADDEACSDMAVAAARQALDMAGISASELSAVIVATTTPDHIFPNTASLALDRLGGKGAFCFDLSAACSGFISSLEAAYALMCTRSQYRYALVIGSEKLSIITNWSDRNTCVLFGDGAGAAVLENTADAGPNTILAADFHADGSLGSLLTLPAGGSRQPATAATVAAHLHTIHMEGRETFKHAVNAMTGACRTVLETAGVRAEQLKLVIPHQANIRIIQAVSQRLGVEDARVFCNIAHYGNTSAASIGICLDEAVRGGRLERGDLVLLTSFGSGLTWGAMLLKY